MSEKQVVSNKMGTMQIPKLLFQISMPMIISMLVQALYNVVDSAFVAQINENALTAVSLVFPVQNLMIAIAVGTGVGINALLSRNLGAGNLEEVNKAAANGIFLEIISAIVFAILGVALAGTFFYIQTNDTQIHEYGIQYMTIISGCCIAVYMQITFERLLQSTGKTFFTMISQGTGAIINIILDPILIFGLLGFPKMGVSGAAIATVCGQIVGMILAIIFNFKFNHEVKISFKGFRPSKQVIGGIYGVGLPSIIMQAIGSVMTFGMNKILLMFTPTATAVFGIYFKLNSFIFMPVFGLNNGMVPIIAYNYGARNKKRIMDTLKLSIGCATVMMLIGVALFWLIPDKLLGIFNASESMLAIGIPALQTISLSFLFAGFCIVAGSCFQALGNGVYSLIISVARQLIVILPVAYVLAVTLGLTAVWWAIPIAELVSLSLTIVFLVKIYKNKVASL